MTLLHVHVHVPAGVYEYMIITQKMYMTSDQTL